MPASAVARFGLALTVGASFAVAWSTSDADPPAAGDPVADPAPIEADVLLERVVFGSTPTMAWSDDGASFAWAAAYDYHLEQTQPADALGIWTWSTDGDVARVDAEARYHPFWMGTELLSSCSAYALCAPGVRGYAADGTTRSLLDEGAWTIVRQGEAVYADASWSGWVRIDRPVSPVATTAAGPPTIVPEGTGADTGCRTHAGRLYVSTDPDRGLIATWGATSRVLDEGRAAQWHHHTVQACLSPDGRHVAWARVDDPVTDLRAATWTLRVLALPDALVAEATSDEPYQGAAVAAATTPLRRLTPRGAIRFTLLGNTPVLSWSPDGQRLLYNASWDYTASWRDSPGSTGLGVFVVDAASGERTTLTTAQRYHPVWVDDDRVASVCSMYEDCDAGVHLHGMDGSTSTLVADDSAYNLQAARAGGLLYHNGGYPGGWELFDVDAGISRGSLATGLSWDVPAGLVIDRCVQQVANVTASAGPTGLIVTLDGEAPVVVDETPAWRYEAGGWISGTGDHSGPIGPCVSPDATRVAWIAQTDAGMELRIQPIGARAAAQQQP